jgi:aspartyl aminopeptidase
MNELERNDKAEAADAKLDVARISEVLKHLNEKKETLQEWLKKIEENDGKEISTVDPDAHLMHTNGDGRSLDACYNVQAVVDEKHKLIVDFDVTTCPDDKGALVTMTESAKEIMSCRNCSNGRQRLFRCRRYKQMRTKRHYMLCSANEQWSYRTR